jgi:hypothetical protein
MRKIVCSLIATSIMLSSVGSFAVERKSVSDIISTNMDLKLSAEEIVAKTLIDFKENNVSKNELNSFLAHELTAEQAQRLAKAQANDLNASDVSSLIQDLNKGAQFIGNSCYSQQHLIWAGVVVSAALFSQAITSSRQSTSATEDSKNIQVKIRELEGKIDILKTDGLEEGKSFIIAGYRADINTYKLQSSQREKEASDFKAKAQPFFIAGAVTAGVTGVVALTCHN